MGKNWWKFLCIAIFLFVSILGLIGDVPPQPILHETIRNLYFHVSIWFGMIVLMLVSLIYSVRSLASNNLEFDLKARSFAEVGFFFSILGLTTGMLWAKFTWGAYWTNDVKLNGTAVAVLIYLAYFVLRSSIEDAKKRSKLASVYNIFAFTMLIVFVGVLPRVTDSLHPGNGGNPGFGTYDLNNQMRLVFYPAVLGWILLGCWLSQIKVRMQKIEWKLWERE